MKKDNKNDLENTVSFGLIDLDKTDTIPQIMSDEYDDSDIDEYEDSNIEEYEDEFQDDIHEGEEYDDEFQDYNQADEEYSDEFITVEEEKGPKKVYSDGPDFDEEKYGDNVFKGQIEYTQDLDDINLEEAGSVEDSNSGLGEESIADISKDECVNIENSKTDESYEELYEDEGLEDGYWEDENPVEENPEDENSEDEDLEDENSEDEDLEDEDLEYEDLDDEDLEEDLEYNDSDDEYESDDVLSNAKKYKNNGNKGSKNTNKNTNKKKSNKSAKKNQRVKSTDNKNKFLIFIKKKISKMGPAEWSLVAGLVIVLIMASLIVSLLIARGRNNQEPESDIASAEGIAEIGVKLENMGVPGEDGLLAMADAFSYVQNVEADVEEIKPETDKIDVLFTSLEKDLKVKFVNTGSEKLVTGIEFKVVLTNSKGNETELVDADQDGIIYQTGLVAGDYTVSLGEVEGYSFENYDLAVNVKDKIVYKQVDVSQEVKKETEVNVAKEDTGKNNVQAEAAENYTAKDTVEWVDSTKSSKDGGDGYSKIDKSNIPEPTYAYRNVISVDNEIKASPNYIVKGSLKTIVFEPEESASDNNSENKEENKEENKTENKTASISFGGNQSVNVDSTITLSPSAECDGNSLPGSGFKDYSSNNTSVASVDSSGKVTGKAEGDATITVKYECTITENGVTKNYTGEGSVKVTVTKVKITVTAIEVDKTAVQLAPNATANIDAKAKLSDDSTTKDGISFTSADEKIAKVDKDGKITAVAKGQTKITVSYKDSYDNKKETTITVTVSDLTAKELTLSKTSTSLGVGKTESIAPTAVMSDDSKITDAAKFSYSSENKEIAKVDGSGVITGVKKGETKITVKYGEGDAAKSATITVKVVEDAASDTSSKLKDKDGNQVYIKNSDGKYVEATYADYYKADEFFIANNSGYKYTGWQTIDGNVYYFDKDGNKVTGEQVIQGVTYKFTDDGILKMDKGSTMGIDVSKWNGTIDWNAVKNSGVSFVIIRCGYRGSTSGVLVEDSKFKSNIQGAQAAGLKVGIYFFTQAVNEVEAVEEASMVIGLIRNYSIGYPVFIDTEQSGGRGDKIDKATRTAVCVAFCETIKNAGYTPGVYASKSWYNDNLNYGSISGYRIWLAQYASAPSFSNRYDIWQHSEKGSVSGISGKVDLNISYMGY